MALWDFLQTSEVLKTTTLFSSHKTIASYKEGIHFLTFKSSFKSPLPGRGHQKGSEEQLRVPVYPLTRGGEAAPHVSAWLGISQELSEITGCPHLHSLGRKNRNNPCKTKTIYTLISFVYPRMPELFLLGFLWITSPTPTLKKLSLSGRVEEEKGNNSSSSLSCSSLLCRVFFLQLLWVMNTLLHILWLSRSA